MIKTSKLFREKYKWRMHFIIQTYLAFLFVLLINSFYCLFLKFTPLYNVVFFYLLKTWTRKFNEIINSLNNKVIIFIGRIYYFSIFFQIHIFFIIFLCFRFILVFYVLFLNLMVNRSFFIDWYSWYLFFIFYLINRNEAIFYVWYETI